MKTVSTMSLIVGFITVAVWGVFAMNHDLSHGHLDCVAAIAEGVDCPREGGLISFASFHLEAFRGFSTATLGDYLVSASSLLVILALGIIFGVVDKIYLTHFASAKNYRCRQFSELLFPLYWQKFVYWLALHENSPTDS